MPARDDDAVPEAASRSLAGSVRRFLSSSECSCSPSSMLPLRPTLPHYPPHVNPSTAKLRPRPATAASPVLDGSTGSPTRTRPGWRRLRAPRTGSGSVVSSVAAVGRERLQRVEVGDAGVRVLRRDRAAADVALRDRRRRRRSRRAGRSSCPPRAARARRCRSSCGSGAVDRVDAELAAERVERRGREQGRRAAAPAVGCAAAAARRAGAARRRARRARRPTGPATSRAGFGRRWKLVSTSSPALDAATHLAAVGERAASARASLVVDGTDQLQQAGPSLLLMSRSRLVDEVEAAVAARAGFEQLDLVDVLERERLHRREGDPGDACGHRRQR